MPNTEWGEEFEEQQVTIRGGVPIWVWGCGGGCLLAALVFLAMFVLGFREISSSTDPDALWARVGEYMPFEARPDDLVPFGIPFLGVLGDQELIALNERSGDRLAVLLVLPAGKEDLRRRAFSEEFEGQQLFMGTWREQETGVIELQGRTVTCLRFVAAGDGDLSAAPGFNTGGPSVLIDITGAGPEIVLLRITKSARGEEELSDEEVRELLEPFDVFDGR